MSPPGFPPQRFQCPRCGGSSFGSILLDPEHLVMSPMHRYCHGNDAGDGVAGCDFNWPDEDDWKHFLVEGKKLPQAEFAALQERIRQTSVEGTPYTPKD